MIKYYGFVEGKVYSSLHFPEKDKKRGRETGRRGGGRERDRVREREKENKGREGVAAGSWSRKLRDNIFTVYEKQRGNIEVE